MHMTTPQALASAASSSVASRPVSTLCSMHSMKTKHDYVANLHEQGHAEQVQTDCEVTSFEITNCVFRLNVNLSI